jgi:hypothetical protein
VNGLFLVSWTITNALNRRYRGNTTNLKIITERPISQHLEKGVMIRVFPDIVQVYRHSQRTEKERGIAKLHTVVFSARSNTLLTVKRPLQFRHI